MAGSERPELGAGWELCILDYRIQSSSPMVVLLLELFYFL
jgi:hypothetical protein